MRGGKRGQQGGNPGQLESRPDGLSKMILSIEPLRFRRTACTAVKLVLGGAAALESMLGRREHPFQSCLPTE